MTDINHLRAEVEKLKEELSIWKSVFPDIAPERVLPDRSKLEAENERLLAVLDLYREAVRIDATMEGPKFMGSNASALKRAWDADRAALEGK